MLRIILIVLAVVAYLLGVFVLAVMSFAGAGEAIDWGRVVFWPFYVLTGNLVDRNKGP